MLQKLCWLLILAFSVYSHCQSLEPVESEIDYDDEFAESWRVVLSPEANEIKKAFKSFIKNRYDIKMKGVGFFGSKDVLKAKDVFITTISSKRINFNVSVLDIDGITEVKVFGSYGITEFFGKEKFNEEFDGLRTVLVNFMNYYLPQYYGSRVQDSREKYDDFLSSSRVLEKNILRNNKKIDELNREIVELQRDLEKNKVEVNQSKINLEKTQVQFNDLKDKLSKVNPIKNLPIVEKAE